MHTEFEELARAKIPAFKGRDEKNNRLVLETLALQGPLIKYDIFKQLKTRNVKYYPTISRRVDDLRKRGYLDVAGKKLVTIGKKSEESSTYALTWRGFIASLTIKNIDKEACCILRINPLLTIPFPKEMAMDVIDELLTPVELGRVIHALLEGFLRALPRDIESTESEKYIAYLIPALMEAPKIQEKFEKKDFSRLFEIPGLLDFILDLVVSFEKQLKASLTGIHAIRNELERYASSQDQVLSKSN